MTRRMRRSQIHQDVYRRIAERFVQWARDAGNLYEMAELEPADLDLDMLMLQTSMIAHAMHRHDIPIDLIVTELRNVLASYRKDAEAEQ